MIQSKVFSQLKRFVVQILLTVNCLAMGCAEGVRQHIEVKLIPITADDFAFISNARVWKYEIGKTGTKKLVLRRRIDQKEEDLASLRFSVEAPKTTVTIGFRAEGLVVGDSQHIYCYAVINGVEGEQKLARKIDNCFKDATVVSGAKANEPGSCVLGFIGRTRNSKAFGVGMDANDISVFFQLEESD